MTPPGELSFQAKEILSWATAAYLLQVVDEPLRVFETHPGDGTYDCLTLMTPEGESVISMNRNGRSALVQGEAVSGIWALAGQTPGKGPRDLANRLLAVSDLDLDLDRAPSGTAMAAATVANWLNLNRNQNARALPIWQFDGYAGDTEVTTLLDGFSGIEGWLRQPSALSGLSATSWIFALVVDRVPVGLVNTRTGDTQTDYMRQSAEAYGKRKSASAAHMSVWPSRYYDDDGHLGCPLAVEVVGYDASNRPASRSIQPLHFAQRYARHLSQENLTVTQRPLFTIPVEGFDWDPPKVNFDHDVLD